MLQRTVGPSWNFKSASGERTCPDIFYASMHHNLQSCTSGASFFFTPLPSFSTFFQFVLHSWPGSSWCEHAYTTRALTCTHSHAAQCSSRHFSRSPLMSEAALHDSGAEPGETSPLHLTSPISCSQSRSGGERAREIKTEHVKSERERKSYGHSDLHILRSSFVEKDTVSHRQQPCAHLQLFCLAPWSKPAGLTGSH